MTKPILDLSQLHSIETDDKSIPKILSWAIPTTDDNLWDLSPLIENRNCKRSDKEIDFRFKLEGDCLTSFKYRHLLSSVKEFLSSRLNHPHPRSGKVAKPRTVVGIWYRIRPLLKWMSENHYQSFADLSPYASNKYKNHVENLNLKPNTVLKRISILEMLYLFSDHYSNPMRQHPWPDTTSTCISGDRKSYASTQTSQMPDEVFTALGRKAIAILEREGEHIICTLSECFDVIESYRDTAIGRIQSGTSQRVERELEFQIERMSVRAMNRRLNAIALENGFKSYGALRDKCDELHTAGYIVCALFSGMRDSELGSLEVGAYHARSGMDGLHSSWLRGMTYKLEDQPVKAEWMVPVCVGLAVHILEDLTQYDRRSLKRQITRLESGGENKAGSKLHELLAWQNSLFLVKGNRGYTYRSMDNETANYRLNKFVHNHNICCESGKPWPLSSHQFRRTFAVFVAKNVMGDLRYLRHHFKHWSMDMTLHYARYQKADESLFTDIMTERDKLNRLIVSDWLSIDTPLKGGRGTALQRFKTRNTVKKEASLSSACTNLADGMFIRGTGHSWCLSNMDSCGGQGLYDSLQCANCDSSVIDPSLIPAWDGIKKQQQELLSLADIGEPVKHHARKIINVADEIIQGLTNEK